LHPKRSSDLSKDVKEFVSLPSHAEVGNQLVA
jgi:hypothetical protein